MKKRKVKKNTGHALFKTEAGILELFKYELDKFYIISLGKMLVFDGKGIFTRKKVEACYERAVVDLSNIIQMPKNSKERKNAIDGLRSLSIFPFKVH